jgi:hypothetical protein
LRPLERETTTTAELKKQLPPGVGVFRRLEGVERVEDTKEVIVRRQSDGWLLSGQAARTALDLASGAASDVSPEEFSPHGWDVFVSAKSAARAHARGTVLLLRWPEHRAAGGRAKKAKVAASEAAAADEPDAIYSALQGKAVSICTWGESLVFTVSLLENSVSAFDMASGALVRVLTSNRYRVTSAYGVAVCGDQLCIPCCTEAEFVEDVRFGVLCLQLPAMGSDSAVFLSTGDNEPFAARRVWAFRDEADCRDCVAAAAMDGHWCTWDMTSGQVVRQADPQTRHESPRCFMSMGAFGRWLFRSWSSVVDVETGEVYEVEEFEDEIMSAVSAEVSSECYDLCVAPATTTISPVVAAGQNSALARCRVFVAYDSGGGGEAGVLELAVNFEAAMAERLATAAERAARPRSKWVGDDDEGLAQLEYMLVRRISMPEDGPTGYRGPSGICLYRSESADILWVNCSLYTFAARLGDGGSVEVVWSAHHCEGDTNEIWDDGPVHVDARGRCYVTTATADPRFVDESGDVVRTVPCVKRFAAAIA